MKLNEVCFVAQAKELLSVLAQVVESLSTFERDLLHLDKTLEPSCNSNGPAHLQLMATRWNNQTSRLTKIVVHISEFPGNAQLSNNQVHIVFVGSQHSKKLTITLHGLPTGLKSWLRSLFHRKGGSIICRWRHCSQMKISWALFLILIQISKKVNISSGISAAI